jgi:hypothetical protein
MLALLPLDDRPCNLRFPRQIAAIGGARLLTPDRALLGRFKVPGDAQGLREWLHSLPKVEALIVSIDMLAYGGLVASRRTQTPLDVALERLQVLKEWRASRPQTPVYAFNILMRLAITMDSDAAIPHYYNVMRWAKLKDEAARFNSDYLNEQLQAVESELPAELLAEYQGARARNHAVNLKMVDWLAEGVFDYLLITQEDCTEYGLHRREQDEIQAHVRELGLTEKFILHPGADEAALTLLAHHWNTGMTLRLHVSNPEDMRRIAAFEDIPYGDSLASHAKAVGAELITDKSARADFEFFVNAPVGNSQREEKNEERAARRENVVLLVEEVAAAVEAGLRVAICDVAFPNGADDLLMRELEKRELLGKLSAFGGWNTAGNTTGTVLAQCAAVKRAAGVLTDIDDFQESQQLNKQFIFERELDDWCYQTKVRSRLDIFARERGISPLSMNGEAGQVEAAARQELNPLAHMLAARQFDSQLEKIEVTLPWGRTFEVEVGAKLG